MAPAQTPPEVVTRLHQEVTEILRSESMVRFISDRGSIAAPSTGAEFDRFIQTEIVKWGEAVRRSGATAQ
jgi:tripartite-type tricarboxylate transporter receptor subunit TctC